MNNRGFLLIEVLIAIVILAMGTSVCFYGLSQNLRVSKVMKGKGAKMEELKYMILNSEVGRLGVKS